MFSHAKVSQFAYAAMEKEKVLSCRQRGKERRQGGREGVTYALVLCVLCVCVCVHMCSTFDVSVQNLFLVEVVDCREQLLQEVCD